MLPGKPLLGLKRYGARKRRTLNPSHKAICNLQSESLKVPPFPSHCQGRRRSDLQSAGGRSCILKDKGYIAVKIQEESGIKNSNRIIPLIITSSSLVDQRFGSRDSNYIQYSGISHQDYIIFPSKLHTKRAITVRRGAALSGSE